MEWFAPFPVKQLSSLKKHAQNIRKMNPTIKKKKKNPSNLHYEEVPLLNGDLLLQQASQV